MNHNTLRRYAIVISSCLIMACSTELDMSSSLKIKTENGWIKGIVDDGVRAFYGIPYAAAPTGNLRWRAPQPAASWEGVRNAQRYGNNCMQVPFAGDAAPIEGPNSEDCLYLNVWRPNSDSTDPLPVMVWIHGGGFVSGGSSPKVYNGHEFAKSGVILVSINYRLGHFGFFSHPELTEESKHSSYKNANWLGNYGLMDQVAALQWVQRNISAFGGDSENVTVFGESAGGRSVNYLSISAHTKGLFHKAITQSGPGRDTENGVRYLSKKNQHGLSSSEALGKALSKKLGADTNKANELDALRGLSAEKILGNLSIMNANEKVFPGVVIDGEFVTQSFEQGVKNKTQQLIPFIIGSNNAELGMLKDFIPEQMKALVDRLFEENPENEASILEFYAPFLDSKRDEIDKAILGSLINGDTIFSEPARFQARHYSEKQPTWRYRFDYRPTHLRNKVIGAHHATEIPFIFKTIGEKFGTSVTEEDREFSKKIHQYWVNFAATGNPNSKGHHPWPSYDRNKEKSMIFSEDKIHAAQDNFDKRLDSLQIH